MSQVTFPFLAASVAYPRRLKRGRERVGEFINIFPHTYSGYFPIKVTDAHENIKHTIMLLKSQKKELGYISDHIELVFSSFTEPLLNIDKLAELPTLAGRSFHARVAQPTRERPASSVRTRVTYCLFNFFCSAYRVTFCSALFSMF